MKSFSPNCTLPPDTPTYVSTVNIRSTLDIIWSCLSIILLCTWTIQHLNVPQQVIARTRGERCGRSLLRILQKSKWMLITIIAPEILTGKALADLISAAHTLHQTILFEEVREGDRAWTL